MPSALVAELDHRGVHRVLGGVEVADEVGQAAVVAVAGNVRLAVDVLGTLVGQRDRQAAIQEGHFLQPA